MPWSVTTCVMGSSCGGATLHEPTAASRAPFWPHYTQCLRISNVGLSSQCLTRAFGRCAWLRVYVCVLLRHYSTLYLTTPPLHTHTHTHTHTHKQLVMLLEIAAPATKCASLAVLANVCSIEADARRVLETPGLSEQLVRCLHHADATVRMAAGRLVCELTKKSDDDRASDEDVAADLVVRGVLAAAVGGFMTSDPAFAQLLTPTLLGAAEADVANARHVLSEAGLKSKVSCSQARIHVQPHTTQNFVGS
jgi:hypothetical protein